MLPVLRNFKIEKVTHNLTLLHTSELKFKEKKIKLVPVNQTSKPKKSLVTEEEIAKKAAKELPEEPTTCCMSGCANCVWLDYAEKLSEYYKDGGEKAIKEVNEKISDPNIRAFVLQEIRMRMKMKK